MLAEGDVAGLLRDSHDAQFARVTRDTVASSEAIISFSNTARAAALAGVGEVGRACKVAFTYGVETDPEVAASFLAKLTLPARHSKIPPHTSVVRPTRNVISLKVVSEAF